MKYLDYERYRRWAADRFSKAAEGPSLFADYIDVVRFFGERALDLRSVTVEYEPAPFALTDPIIRDYAEEIAARMTVESRLRPGTPVMKLVGYNFAATPGRLIVRPCDYRLQAGTCLAMDLPHHAFVDYGGTLRGYYRHDCPNPTVENNPLAICLGVCGYLLVEEQGQRFLLQIERSENLASLEGEWGPSVAGVVDYADSYCTLDDLVRGALGAELAEELGLGPDEYSIVPLAWAIELFRGERPQVFCLVRTSLGREEVTARLEAVDPTHREFKSYQFIPHIRDAAPDNEPFGPLNFEARMNLVLLNEKLG